MGKPLVLLGAGASIDAGLPDTFGLTELVYKRLQSSPQHATSSLLFGYVIAKLIARHVRSGGSPFDRINVEHAYDGLFRLLNRESDPLNDFVYSWDPILDVIRSRFNEDRFVRGVESAIGLDSRSSISGNQSIRLKFDKFKMRQAASEISKAFNPLISDNRSLTHLLQPFLQALVDVLSIDCIEIEYIQSLVTYCIDKKVTIATLNYDTLIEECAVASDASVDLGLERWNDRKIVQWARHDMKIMKLHGSINWFGSFDNISVGNPTNEYNTDRIMIFGGQSSKLNPEGPFLQLRHEFERQLLQTNALLIVGYSFGDLHLNSLIRRWVSTRRKAKLIVIDPGNPPLGVNTIGYPFKSDKTGKVTSYTVEIEHIKETAKNGMNQALHRLSIEPNPKLHTDKSSALIKVSV